MTEREAASTVANLLAVRLFKFSTCAVQYVLQPKLLSLLNAFHIDADINAQRLTESYMNWITVLSSPSQSNGICQDKKGRTEDLRQREGISRGFFFVWKEKNSATLATVLFLNTLSCSCSSLWNVSVFWGRLQKWRQKHKKQSQNVRISCDILYTGPALWPTVGGIHTTA